MRKTRSSVQPLVTTLMKLKNCAPLKPINLSSKSEIKRRVNILFDCLQLLSGTAHQDFIIKSLLQQKRTETTLSNLRNILHPQYVALLRSLNTAHHSISTSKKRQILSLVADTHSYQAIREVGFNINRRNYLSAKRHGTRHGPGQPVPTPVPPPKKRKMNEQEVKQFHDYLLDHSREAANRVVKNIPARYVEGCPCMFLPCSPDRVSLTVTYST